MNVMIYRKIIYWKSTFINLLLSLLLFAACTDDQNTLSDSEFTYLVEYEKIHSLQKNLIIAAQIAASWQYPEMIQLNDSAATGVDVYRLIYRTTLHGQEIMASGLACIPSGNGIFPILSFQNGTNTAHDLAPSENAGSTTSMLLQGLAANGYILLIPDYIGFGSSDSILHPFYVKEPTIRSVIDFIYAGREFIDNFNTDAVYNQDCFLAGYSQGGWASLAVLSEIEKNESIDIQVKAASCGAGAYDLVGMTNYVVGLDSFPAPYYLPYYLYTHKYHGFLSDPMEKYFREPFVSAIPQLFDGSYSNIEVKEQLTFHIPDLLTNDFIKNFSNSDAYAEIRSDMQTNSVAAWNSSTILRFYHGTHDLHVPAVQSKEIYQQFLSILPEKQVEYFDIINADHNSGVIPWGVSTIMWFNEMK